MTEWELIYRMTKDHDGDTEAALYKIREIARDMIDADELIQKIKQEDLSGSHMPDPNRP